MVEGLPEQKAEENMKEKDKTQAKIVFDSLPPYRDKRRSRPADRTWEEMVENPEAVSETDFNEMGDSMEEAWKSRADLFYGFRKAGLCSRFLYLVFPHWFCDDLYRRIK